MTKSFSFYRLSQLIKKQWLENARMYIIGSFAMLALLALVLSFYVRVTNQYSEDAIYIILLGGLFIAGAIFSSLSFNVLGDRSRGTYWLSLPASHLEKLVCAIFYSLIVFTIIYTAVFFLLQSVVVHYINQLVAENPMKYSFHRFSGNDGFWIVFKIMVYAFVAVQAFYLLGSVYFSRYAFILTTVVGSLLLFLLSQFLHNVSEAILGNEYSWNGTYAEIAEAGSNGEMILRQYDLSPMVTNAITIVFKFIWAPVFWTVAWFRLKEKQL